MKTTRNPCHLLLWKRASGTLSTSLPIPNSQWETSNVLTLLVGKHKPILPILHCPPKHTVANRKDEGLRTAAFLACHCVWFLVLKTWVLVLLIRRKEAWHLKSKGKILTKTQILNSFHALKKTKQNKTKQPSILFPHFKAFSVLRENWKGARGLYTAQTSVLTGRLANC